MNTTQMKQEEMILTSIEKYMQHVRIIAFNGPPRCGKDTAVETLIESIEQAALKMDTPVAVHKASYARPLKQMVHQILRLDVDAVAFDNVKDVPNPAFKLATPRQAYINFSEGFIKPTFGETFWADRLIEDTKLLTRQFYTANPEARRIFLISDIGFQIEADTLRRDFPPSYYAIARINRDGTSFDNDSRGYVFGNALGHVWEGSIYNNTSLDYFKQSVISFATSFFHTDADPVYQQLADAMRAA